MRDVRTSSILVAAVTAAVLAPRVAAAHFLLVAPEAATVQGLYGDPLHTAPCGGDESAEPTNVITPFTQGETITVTLDEKIYHPGHFRIALALESPDDLPAPPPVTPDMATDCGSVPIADPPVFPILADGVFPQDSPGTWPQSAQVTLPADVTCTRCVLQVLKFTSSHDAPCFEYHCAHIAIAEPAPPPECTDDAACADADQCTTDTCDDAGACVHAAVDPASCDDGDACTTDACVAAAGCTSTALTLADVGPGFLGDVAPPACASEPVPGAIASLVDQAGSFVTRAAASATKRAKFLKRADARLKKASKKTTKAGKRRISSDCATAILVVLDAARTRVGCLAR